MSEEPPKPPAPPQPEQPVTAPSKEDTLLPFVTQAFNNLFNQLSGFTQELSSLKVAVDQIDQLVKSRLDTIEPQFQELLSNVREQRRSSVTHYSQLAATVAQGFESLGDLRSGTTDEKILTLLTETLQAAQDALYCLRMERLIRRYLNVQKTLQSSGK